MRADYVKTDNNWSRGMLWDFPHRSRSPKRPPSAGATEDSSLPKQPSVATHAPRARRHGHRCLWSAAG
ncbi:hypothetical protein BaRGS_00026566 [Batillaria attramentaria]|uniref:Uncharacterized protein n=1 Tax=Batillaria attramentaria TaxID=370345 RepID=A0ABD0K562_9CAEN